MSRIVRAQSPAVAERRALYARSRRTRGAAMVEAAFMMPMFVILFFTSLYAHNLNAKQISLNMTTRASAWALAMYNCSKGPASDEGETLQAANSGGTGEPQTISLSGGSGNDASNAASSAFSGGSVSGALSSVMSGITSAIASVFPNPQGSQSQIHDTVSWRMPNVYVEGGSTSGPNSTPVGQTVTVVCNEQAVDGSIGQAVKDIICAVTGQFC